jgi:hypothetical protein
MALNSMFNSFSVMFLLYLSLFALVGARLAGECAMLCNDLRNEVLTPEMCRYVALGPAYFLASPLTVTPRLVTQRGQENSSSSQSWGLLLKRHGAGVL